jgi:tRNA pseudouridine55 synthase
MEKEVPPLTDDDVIAVLESYYGKTKQRVPAYSAVRVNGRRLYEAARRGEHVEQPVREIEVSAIRLLAYHEPRLEFEVTCSKGTYIRSLANDIGERLGCGGYLASLSRIAIGPFRLEDALTLDAVAALHEDGELDRRFLPIDTALPYAVVRVTDEFSPLVIHGRSLRGKDVVGIEGRFSAGDNIILKNRHGVILAVGTAGIDSTDFRSGRGRPLFNYLRVLN